MNILFRDVKNPSEKKPVITYHSGDVAKIANCQKDYAYSTRFITCKGTL
jgi:hypothetical protein